MPSRVVVFGFIMVLAITVFVCMVEFFVPLSAKSDMNIRCRNTLIKMEIQGGLSQEERTKLLDELGEKGFRNTIVEGTPYAKQGDEITLQVEADYSSSRLTGLLVRRNETYRMVYNKTSTARRIIN